MRPVAILLALALTACTGLAAPPLNGTEWLSTGVTEDGADRPLVNGTRIRLRFLDGELGASAGCNTMGGTYRIDEDTLIFEGGAMTEMGCDEERHAQDDWLFEFLGSRPTVAQAEDKLTLTSGTTVLSLQDSEVAEPDLPLVGTTWTVDSILSGDAASSVPDGVVAGLVFTPDGMAEVSTGCNAGVGRYEVDDGMLRIRGVGMTQAGCDEATGQVEAAMLALLNVDLAYTIDAGSLTLMAGDSGLILRDD